MRASIAIRYVAVAAAMLLLTSCQQDAVGNAGAGGGTGSGTPAPTDAPDTTPGTSDGTDIAAGVSGCPIGRWQLDNASWERALGKLLGQGGVEATVAVTGVQTVDWRAGGTYTLSADDAEFTVSGTSSGQRYTLVITHDGTESGTWSGGDGLSGGSYQLATVDNSGWRSSGTMSAGGVDVKLDNSGPGLWSDEVTVECAGAVMRTTVTHEGASATVEFTRLG